MMKQNRLSDMPNTNVIAGTSVVINPFSTALARLVDMTLSGVKRSKHETDFVDQQLDKLLQGQKYFSLELHIMMWHSIMLYV